MSKAIPALKTRHVFFNGKKCFFLTGYIELNNLQQRCGDVRIIPFPLIIRPV
jgi:hypothetical protein